MTSYLACNAKHIVHSLISRQLKLSESLRRPVCHGQTLNVLSVTPVRGYSFVGGFRMPASKASLVARESPLSSVLRQRAIATILRNRGRALSSAAKGVPAPLWNQVATDLRLSVSTVEINVLTAHHGLSGQNSNNMGTAQKMKIRVQWFITLFLFVFSCALAKSQDNYTAASRNQNNVNAIINGPTHAAVNIDTATNCELSEVK